MLIESEMMKKQDLTGTSLKTMLQGFILSKSCDFAGLYVQHFLKWECYSLIILSDVLVSSIREAARFSDLSQEEVADLFVSTQMVSNAVKQEFNATSLSIAIQVSNFHNSSSIKTLQRFERWSNFINLFWPRFYSRKFN